MASLTTVQPPLIEPRSEVLSPEQIERLLQDAEHRLRDRATNERVLTSNLARNSVSIPKIQHNLNFDRSLAQKPLEEGDRPGDVTSTQPVLTDKDLRAISIKSKKPNDTPDAGQDWFNLLKTEMTPSLKRDLQVIEMRNVLDPHRHYKKNTRKDKVPAFSQTGTVIEGPTEFYTGRINKKERSKNFVEETMRTEQGSGRFKRKYGEIQAAKTSGRKAHYKKLVGKRTRR